MTKRWSVLLLFCLFFSFLSPGYASETLSENTKQPSNYIELYSFLPMQCWVKVDTYEMKEDDITSILAYIESSTILKGKKIQSAKVYPVSLPILLVSHSLRWKAHYFSQIRVLCNFGNETQTVHISGVRFEKSNYWVFSLYSSTPCLKEIGSSDGFYSMVSFPALYPSPSLFFAYFTKHMQSIAIEDMELDLQRGIPLLFSAQIWNPFFNSDLPFIEQDAKPARFEDLVIASNSEDLFNFIPNHYSVQEIQRELTEKEKTVFVEHSIVMMKDSGYENPNHYDWDSVKIDVPIIIGLSEADSNTSEYFSDVALYVSKVDKPDIQNRYVFSAYNDGDRWLFHSADQISSTEGWHFKLPRVYTFSGQSYNESTYLYYISMINILLLNRYPLEHSKDITRMWSLKRWNFSSI
ncbi:MAG: hypothetical protein PHI40_02355 [Caldisericia bacterium]|nr:hypothetical protein [Caldisericia bacterium]MDD4614235.1 hypothetical protein [Caldisericia bacterium]